jgi:hypothetical protein
MCVHLTVEKMLALQARHKVLVLAQVLAGVVHVSHKPCSESITVAVVEAGRKK